MAKDGLKIRITLGDGEQQQAISQPIKEELEPQYEYHYTRIILALCLIVMLCAGLFWLLFQVFQRQSESELLYSEVLSTESFSVIADHEPKASSKIEALEVLSDAEQVDVSTDDQQDVRVSPEPAALTLQPKLQLSQLPQPVELELESLPEEPAPRVLADADLKQGLQRSADNSARIVVHSSSVVRAHFASGVESLEPVDNLNTVLAFQPDESYKKLYFYTQVDGMKDQILYHVWIHNGAEVARVKIPVWGNRWRCYSSKQLLSSMLGQWRVRLVNSQEEILAEGEFELAVL